MLDPDTTVLYSENWEEIVGAVNQVARQLPPEVRGQFNTIKLHYLAAYDVRGLYDRVNGRTVTQVIAEYGDQEGPEVVEEGERDGVRYTLYERPDGKDRTGSHGSGPEAS